MLKLRWSGCTMIARTFFAKVGYCSGSGASLSFWLVIITRSPQALVNKHSRDVQAASSALTEATEARQRESRSMEERLKVSKRLQEASELLNSRTPSLCPLKFTISWAGCREVREEGEGVPGDGVHPSRAASQGEGLREDLGRDPGEEPGEGEEGARGGEERAQGDEGQVEGG